MWRIGNESLSFRIFHNSHGSGVPLEVGQIWRSG